MFRRSPVLFFFFCFPPPLPRKFRELYLSRASSGLCASRGPFECFPSFFPPPLISVSQGFLIENLSVSPMSLGSSFLDHQMAQAGVESSRSVSPTRFHSSPFPFFFFSSSSFFPNHVEERLRKGVRIPGTAFSVHWEDASGTPALGSFFFPPPFPSFRNGNKRKTTPK